MKKQTAKKKAPAKKAASKRAQKGAHKKSGVSVRAPDLSMIATELRPMARPIEDLRLDPKNAKQHGSRNLKAIAESYKQFGQVKPIVAVEGVVIAGNGQIEAAKSLGWSHIAVVEFADVKKARAFALADNRTSELDVSWDTDRLAQSLAEIGDLGLELVSLGFGTEDLATLLDGIKEHVEFEAEKEPEPAEDQSEQLGESRMVIVDCETETEQQELFEELSGRGLKCRVITQ